VLSDRSRLILLTAVAPALWGTTYATSTAFLVPGHPLLAATLRALPAGLVLLAVGRRLPRGAWWWRSVVLGALNIGAFFAFLFIAADRLPGGVAAVIGGIQPLLVSALAARVLRERLPLRAALAGVVGLAGVALIVLRADARLDATGVAAAVAGATCMATGVVLAKRWGSDHPPLVTTSWQLLAGGILLAALTAVCEPLPTAPLTPANVAGYAYLALVGTALAYLLWSAACARSRLGCPRSSGCSARWSPSPSGWGGRARPCRRRRPSGWAWCWRRSARWWRSGRRVRQSGRACRGRPGVGRARCPGELVEVEAVAAVVD
jgi:probable blue pigment (indigoidine) exporter